MELRLHSGSTGRRTAILAWCGTRTALKADYVRERGLGGVMIWELSGDDGTLLETLHRRLQQ
ncbi:hypothetical protein BH24GEM3_BH24GEM3_25190 [soil metagenome]